MESPTPAQKLKFVEDGWIANNVAEDFAFEIFDQPKQLRRSKTFPGALCELVFGRYENLHGTWISDERVVWLGMITSDIPGHGGRLLDKLSIDLARFGISLIGTPTPLKPRDWKADRAFSHDVGHLTDWYRRHGFRVLQNKHDTRVVHLGFGHNLNVDFEFK